MTPIIIAGPCSIESLDQLRTVTTLLVNQLSTSHELWIRGGVWKPRTRPGGFEGQGEEALHWMAQLKKEMPAARFCCEVATPEHVELCLRYSVDAVWIGSRTTGNPFSVDEVCSALKGSTLPVMVKNPMTPDVKLWLGAIERVMQAGTSKVSAVHRGFTPYHNTLYRNNPLWEVPIELRRLMPDLPLLCDPSHIGGQSDYIGPLMQTAMDLHFDGLMVEVHPQPSSALTDASQQLTPAAFFALLDRLKLHQDCSVPRELILLRQQIDLVDSQIMEALGNRLRLAKRIAQVKADNNMAVFQPKRWEEVLAHKMHLAQDAGIDPQFVKEIYEKIHSESVKVQLEN